MSGLRSTALCYKYCAQTLMNSPEQKDGATQVTTRKTSWPFMIVALCIMFVLLAAVAALWYEDASPSKVLSSKGPPAFVRTEYARIEPPPGATIWQRLRIFYANSRFGRRRPNVAAWTFPPRADQPWSVQGLLNQCMELTGTQYLLAREGLRDTIDFGHSKPLNGVQWTAAVEAQLEKNGYTLIRDKKVVKVVPQHKLDDYRKAGLIK